MALDLQSIRSLPSSHIAYDQCGGELDGQVLCFDRSSSCMSWYSNGGVQLFKQFHLSAAPELAIFCRFDASHSHSPYHDSGGVGDVVAKNAVAILLPNDDLRLYMASGETYDIHLPYPVRRMLAAPYGLLFQRDCYSSPSSLQFFWLSNPLAPFSLVENQDSMVELLEQGDQTALCIGGNVLFVVSADGRTGSLLELRPLDNEADARPNLISDRIKTVRSGLDTSQPVHSPSNFTFKSPPYSAAAADTPACQNTAEAVRRSPMAISRENSPYGLNAGSLNYSTHRSNDAALQSLLESTPEYDPVAIVPLERSLSGVRGNGAPRAQPVMYSRGTSGASTDTGAFHIRKKRGGSGPVSPRHSPRHSPRPSPSAFLFDSGSAMDVDRSRWGSIADSPPSTGGSTAMDTTGHNASAARERLYLTENDQAHLSLGLSEMYVMRVATFQLSSPVTSARDVNARFSGSVGGVGGRMLHIFDKSTGQYSSYELKASIPASALDESAVSECKSFRICGAAVGSEDYKVTLVYSTTTAETGEVERYLGVAHASVPLHTIGAVVPPRSFLGASVLPRRLQSDLQVPITLALTEEQTVLLLIGGQVVSETPLHWGSDLADLEDDEASARGVTGSALGTLFSGGPHVSVTTQEGTRILLLSSLFPQPAVRPAAEHGACVLADATTALTYSLLDLKIDGLVESTLNFLTQIHSRQGGMVCVYWLLAGSLGVDAGTFSASTPSQLSAGMKSAHAASCASPELQQLYLRFLADATSLYSGSGSTMCLGVEVFHTLHTLLQEYRVRFGEERARQMAEVQELRAVLAASLQLLAAVQQGHESADMRGACAAALADYSAYYSEQNVKSADVDSVVWLAAAINELTRCSSSPETAASLALPVFPLPFPVQPATLCSFPTIHLVARFLEYLAWTVQQRAAGEIQVPSPAYAIMDAYVYSAHGPDTIDAAWDVPAQDARCDWSSVLALFPPTLRTLLQLSARQSQAQPNPRWPAYLLALVQRQDLGGYAMNSSTLLALKTYSASAGESGGDAQTSTTAASSAASGDVTPSMAGSSDGLVEVEKASFLRFTEDDRVHEVCRMLRSSQHLYLKFEKPPEVSELEHRHKLQLKLLNLVKRSLAVPVGRGMLTMASLEPFMAETLPIPPLCLTGRVPPANSIVALDTTNAHADLTLWPDFHNGVAAALRVGPAEHDAVQIKGASRMARSARHAKAKVTRNWIIYNRLVSQSKAGGESTHAGFLLGLGLLGHLPNLSVTDTYEYLKQGHEPTTIAVLIGSAASRVGAADPRVFKTISLYMPPLLPAPHGDLEIAPAVQAAGLVGLGLLYCGTGHRMMAEFLLTEMSRSPSSDRIECREAMVTAAAWSLGMVLLGKGSCENMSIKTGASAKNAPSTPGPARGGVAASANTEALRGLQDLRVESRLLQFLEGGKRPGESALFPSHPTTDISSRSSRLLEGKDININITAPGAAIALGLIFIRSNNAEMLQRLSLPSTIVALEAIWSDLLIYRAIASCLVQWEEVIPTEDWIRSRIPEAILSAVFPPGSAQADAAKKDPKLLYQTGRKLNPRTALSHYLCSVTGYCFGMGIVFAGTSNATAKQTILTHLRLLQSFRENKPLMKLAFTLDKVLRGTVEMCMCATALSLASVMAGSGDLDSLRILRELRWKVDDVVYGTHMALSMAIGLLFLGGGNFSLRRDPLSAACLLLSFLPKYPVRTVEQQYHLQATRHLYVLAAEPRALHTIDVDSGLTVPVDVEVELLTGEVLQMTAPGLLPELATVRKVSVRTEDMTPIGAHDAPQAKRYHASSITLSDDDTADTIAADAVIGHLRAPKMRTLLGTHGHVAVPPLFVKQIASPSYLDAVPADTARPEAPQHSGILSQGDSSIDCGLEEIFQGVRGEDAGGRGSVGGAGSQLASAIVNNPMLMAVLLGASNA